MKKIIINESDEKLIEAFLKTQEMPKFIIKALKNNKTSLGDNPSFPPEDEYKFDEKIAIKRFNEIKESLKNIEELTSYTEENIQNLLNKLIYECQEKEKPIRKNLEKICFNTISQLFDIPSDLIIYSCNLSDSIDKRKFNLRLTPESADDIEFEDIAELENINDEIYKRRLIDAIVIGASMRYTDKCRKYYLSDIFDLDPKLPEIYSKIIRLNNYLNFIKSGKDITDESPKQGGVVNVVIGNDNVKTKIEVNAVIFPILLSESIKGFMELFASHGLPNKIDMAKYVVKKSDFLIAEPWDMRLGPILWDYITDCISNDDTKIIPNIFSIIVTLPCNEFFKLMKEVFGKTKKGKKVMKLIVDKVKHDVELDDLSNDIKYKNNLYNKENDKYITISELDNEFLGQ